MGARCLNKLFKLKLLFFFFFSASNSSFGGCINTNHSPKPGAVLWVQAMSGGYTHLPDTLHLEDIWKGRPTMHKAQCLNCWVIFLIFKISCCPGQRKKHAVTCSCSEKGWGVWSGKGPLTCLDLSLPTWTSPNLNPQKLPWKAVPCLGTGTLMVIPASHLLVSVHISVWLPPEVPILCLREHGDCSQQLMGWWAMYTKKYGREHAGGRKTNLLVIWISNLLLNLGSSSSAALKPWLAEIQMSSWIRWLPATPASHSPLWNN